MLARRRAIVSATPPRTLGMLTAPEEAALGAAVGVATAGVVVLSVLALGVWALAATQRGDVSRVIVTPYRTTPPPQLPSVVRQLPRRRGPRWWRWR